MPRYVILQLTRPTSIPEGSNEEEVNEAYFRASFGKPSDAVKMRLYQAAALVEAEDPEDLFVKTQNIDAPWTEVSPPIAGDLRQRSTSIGDFIVNVDTPEILVCASPGWEPAAPEDKQVIQSLATQAFVGW
jgi:hypothetical protein